MLFPACQCNNHSLSCSYNETLGHGVCDDCMHGTAGYFCERCDQRYYPNPNATIRDVNACFGKWLILIKSVQ